MKFQKPGIELIKERISINYELKEETLVSFTLCNVMGENIQTILPSKKTAGMYSLNWNTKELHLSAGTYFVTMDTGKKKYSRKLIVY